MYKGNILVSISSCKINTILLKTVYLFGQLFKGVFKDIYPPGLKQLFVRLLGNDIFFVSDNNRNIVQNLKKAIMKSQVQFPSSGNEHQNNRIIC